MKKGELKTLIDAYLNDDAEMVIAENPKCLMGIEQNVCIMIKLDGNWER
ncbi:MAG: hypothetical protein J6Y78_04455 [Paludibacteraceae bacterium]|nr:hypothetical protein [Paludibacteraceae bacterium]